MGAGKNVGIIGEKLIFYEWYTKKLHEKWPDIVIDGARISKTSKYDLDKDLIFPNLDHFSILLQRDHNAPDLFKVTFKKLGRFLQKGSGTDFDNLSLKEVPIRSSCADLPGSSSAYDPYRELLSEYAYFPLAKGLAYSARDRLPEAKECVLKVPSTLFPFCYPLFA